MKITIQALRQINETYGCTGDIAPEGIDELVRKIGAQLGEVDEVTDLTPMYKGIVVAKVIRCADHPNADRLHVCTIDDGGVVQNVSRDSDGLVQVVCGAPNVREGLTVAWLPPGATVPESYGKDPFVLEARELRGVVSNGMLASPKELGLGESHDGIMELDDSKAAGTDFAEAYKLNDQIIDIENKMFTHRPDCFGFLGVDRELAGIRGMIFKSPDWYSLGASVAAPEAEQLPLHVENELPSLVPRFSAVVLRDVAVGPSPVWLQVLLNKVGLRPINNIVDYTNFYMLLTGQPLHAYDYDKVAALSDGEGATIVVRNPRDNEQIVLLNGKTIDPRQAAIMIATNKQLIGVGGVMGGAETEVGNDTKNIILEAASFDMYSIRRTSMEHGLFTDAVTRFSKGQSPLQTVAVLAKITEDIREHAGGKVASELIDLNEMQGRAWVHPPVPVTAAFINARLGLTLQAEAMKTLLENVEFHVEVDGDKLTVAAPFWRTDIETREDVVEEVGRLYGFDKLPLVLPKRSIKPVRIDAHLTLKQAIRTQLARLGANELLTYSFVHGNLLQKVGQDAAKAFRLSNALSPDLQYFRLSLTPSLLDKVHTNIKAGYDQFALFELGKTHHAGLSDEAGLPHETDALALVVAASDKTRPAGAAYYQAKAYLDNIANTLGSAIEFVSVESLPDEQQYKPYVANRSALVRSKTTGDVVGVVGEFSAAVLKNLKLPAFTAGFEVSLHGLSPSDNTPSNYRVLSRFPKTEQDISLRVERNVQNGELLALIQQQLETNLPDHLVVTAEPLGIYMPNDNDAVRHHTFRLKFVNYERTMIDDEVSKIVDTVAAVAAQTFGAERL